MNNKNKSWYDILNDNKRKEELKRNTILFIRIILFIFFLWASGTGIMYLKKQKVKTEKIK